MNLSTLKYLQSRIREATGADPDLDFAIRKTFKLGPLWCSRYITDPDDMAPRYTTDPDGLGACVELMRSLLPDAHWEISRTALRPGMIPGGSPHEYRADVGDWGTPCRKWHDRAPHALLLAICAALIAEEEAKLKDAVG